MRELTETKILDSLNSMITVLKQNVSDMLEIMEERERQVQDSNNQIYEIENNWSLITEALFIDEVY